MFLVTPRVPVYYTKWCTGQIRYKKLEDVASVEEFWQWLEGPFAHNIIYCAKGTGGGSTYRTDGGGGGGAEPFNAEDLLPGNRRPCRVGDGKFVRKGAVQIRSIRVQRRACEFGWADAWDSNRTLFKGYVAGSREDEIMHVVMRSMQTDLMWCVIQWHALCVCVRARISTLQLVATPGVVLYIFTYAPLARPFPVLPPF